MTRPGTVRRVAAACLASACAAAFGGGCGGNSRETVRASDPAVAFAPLVALDGGERWMPVGARWFIERSVLLFAEEEGCDDRRIAVGRTLKEQRTPVTDWIFLLGLAGDIAYKRTPHDARCEERAGEAYYADQPTRPFERPDRPAGLRPEEGFYLDLVDRRRPGPAASGQPGRETVNVPVYYERAEEEVDGRAGLRLTYWMLYGMNEPRGADGSVDRDGVHEGDWERVEVLLQRGDGDGDYVPVALRLPVRSPTGGDRTGREIPWSELRALRGAGSRAATHPVLAAAAGSHELSPVAGACEGCVEWRTWRRLLPAARQLWFGFGGAWGEPGPTAHRTGPLGPHGDWPRTAGRG